MKIKVIFAVSLMCASLRGFAQSVDAASPSADQVIATMLARDGQRESLSAGYTGSRKYVLDNQKLNKRAVMLASITCDPDGTKHFAVVSEEGWKSANNHVLRKMLESESETSRPLNRPKSRLTSDNYTFPKIQVADMEGRPTYVIEVAPKRQDKTLFRGRIWVDAEDYALVRVEGEPAKAPSFWTRRVQFVQQYKKYGAFWFPLSTTSVTEAMIFGTTNVSIHYFDYTPASNAAHGLATSPYREVNYVNH